MEFTESQLESLLYSLPFAKKSLEDLSAKMESQGSILMPLMIAQTLHDLAAIETLIHAHNAEVA